MAYGLLLNLKELGLGEVHLKVSDIGHAVLYLRKSVEGSKEITVYNKNLYLIPYPPVLLPERGLFRHIMIGLEDPMVVPPGSEVELTRYIPVDLAVVLDISDPSSTIDVFSLRTPKLAVYGEVQEGVLTRYLNAVRRSDKGLAEVEVKVLNKWESTAEFSRIVINAYPFFLCFKPNTWNAKGPRIKVVIGGRSDAIVEVSPPKCPEDYITLSIGGSGLFGAESSRYEMKYGYSRRSLMTWGY